MSMYEYPDLWFPGCFEMEAYADPHFIPAPEEEVNDLKESRLDKYLQALLDFLEKISGKKQAPTRSTT